ncbi:hypothetical protein BD770DRAFT_416799 [Pilaira anomala]|nr:hypothetical protein BD770DRAFT_416799 [Pilaira anomala]
MSDSNYPSDTEVVKDKPSGIKIKGEAKRQRESIKKEQHLLKTAVQSFLESKQNITIYQKRRQTILEQKILPHIRKEFEMIHMLDQDKTTNIHKKKAYLRTIFQNKNDAIAFYKKHLHHI